MLTRLIERGSIRKEGEKMILLIKLLLVGLFSLCSWYCNLARQNLHLSIVVFAICVVWIACEVAKVEYSLFQVLFSLAFLCFLWVWVFGPYASERLSR